MTTEAGTSGDSGMEVDSGAGGDSGTRQDSGTNIDSGDDASLDAGLDAARDAGFDAARDAGSDLDGDGGLDAGRDAGFDASRDGGFDAGRDGGRDAGRDAGLDTGIPDARTDAPAFDGGPTDGGTGCSGTLTGALSASFSCTPAASYQSGSDFTQYIFMVWGLPLPGGILMLQLSAGHVGEGHTGTFTSVELDGYSLQTSNGSTQWRSTSAASGMITLALSSVTVTSSSTFGDFYAIDGTLDATLTASGQPPVLLHLDF